MNATTKVHFGINVEIMTLEDNYGSISMILNPFHLMGNHSLHKNNCKKNLSEKQSFNKHLLRNKPNEYFKMMTK